MKLEQFNTLNQNPNKESITEETDNNLIKRLKFGVDYVFEQNPELSQIGNKEQYLEYLNSIFPDSVVKDIVYHGTDTFEKDNQKISGFDNLDEGIFFTDNLKYAKSYARYRGGDLIIPAMIKIKKPARDENCKELFGCMNEDPNLYEGYSGLKKAGFDGYISDPNFDTPYSEIYTDDPEYIADRKKIEEMKKQAEHIDLESINKNFVVDRNYAIQSSYYYNVTRKLDKYGIKYNLYSVDTINGIVYVNGEEKKRKNYQSINYVIFNKTDMHQLGSKHDMQRFKEYLSSTKNK